MLKLLNIVAPAYFLCGAAVTFALQLFLFIPAIFGYPSTSIPPFTLFHGVLFLFLATNTMGNYILTILNPSECVQDSTFDKKATDQADGVDNQLIKATHFCKLCSKVIWKRDHHCLFTGNCIGKRNLRYFIMFCLYTSLTCLYSLVLGVAYLTLEYALSFGSPLTFLTLLPLLPALQSSLSLDLRTLSDHYLGDSAAISPTAAIVNRPYHSNPVHGDKEDKLLDSLDSNVQDIDPSSSISFDPKSESYGNFRL
ncbi:palmitoyltransferase ZDHHC22 [Protopterus annectens]|uniref:palmitoyltransferase ZDHHC22 n=1 Tax=Protopterus annectens TaxID=7888 RepID=UPI001CF980E6|nr:palmitoyltransferase ZDHHC22 [Protopterus annectens]